MLTAALNVVLRPVPADFREQPAHPATTSEFKHIEFFDLTGTTPRKQTPRCSPLTPEMPGCSTPRITWPYGWRGMVIRKTSTSRRRRPASPSVGLVDTELMVTLSCTVTRTPAGSSPSWATLPAALRNGADRETSNMFG